MSLLLHINEWRLLAKSNERAEGDCMFSCTSAVSLNSFTSLLLCYHSYHADEVISAKVACYIVEIGLWVNPIGMEAKTGHGYG